MAWEARTAFVEIKPGTRLCIYETRQVDGHPPLNLLGSHPLQIHINDRWIDAQVIEATLEHADLKLPGGDKFEMTPLEYDEFPSGITADWMHSQDWVIRRKLDD